MGRTLGRLARDTTASVKAIPLPSDVPARSSVVRTKRKYVRKTNTTKREKATETTPLRGTAIALKMMDLDEIPDRPTDPLYAIQAGRMSDGRLYTLLNQAETNSLFVKAHQWSRSSNGRLRYEAWYYRLNPDR